MGHDDATLTLQQQRPMTGGAGSLSYAQNSQSQLEAFNATKEMIIGGIKEKLDMKSLVQSKAITNIFRIVDFGCSTGPNSFFAMQSFTEAVEHEYNSQLIQRQPPLEFQVFFNDLTHNDFNTLFKSIPPQRNYFLAGVPGSFYDRLFPKSSLHLAYSCYALHWLSKLPEEVMDPRSPAWNKDSIQCTGHVKEVAEAYSKQFKSDFGKFLNMRAQEIVNGGLMMLVVLGLPDGVIVSQTTAGAVIDLLGSSLTDMAKLGLVGEEKVESFNMPSYLSTAMEIEEIINDNSQLFSLEKMETVDRLANQPLPKPEIVARTFRATVDGLLKAHFGSDIVVEEIFKRFIQKATENYFLFDKIKHHTKDFFILLKRNTN